MAQTRIADIFIAELENAVARDRQAAARLTHDRFKGLPTNTTAAIARVTNNIPDLIPNEDGDFLHAA